MRSTPLYTGGRTARFAAAAILGLAALAACESDQPLSPKSPSASVPTSAKPAVDPSNTGNLAIKLVDKVGSLVPAPFAEFVITGSGPNSWLVIDNLLEDTDSTSGKLVLKKLAAGNYKICEKTPPAGYGVGAPSCTTTTVYAGATTGVFFVNVAPATITLKVNDDLGNPRGDKSFVLDSNHVFVAIVSDNDVHDIDPTVGTITMQLFKDAQYELCQNGLPWYYITPNQPTCTGQVAIKMATSTDFGTYTMVPTYPSRWAFTDGKLDANNQYKLLGGAKFQVHLPNNTVADGEDNGVLDYDPVVGRVAVALPYAGTYSICETTPPPNHKNATPACKTLTAVANTISDIGFFINPLSLVVRQLP